MGSTVSPCTSFRMTIGALVDGSTISPRIFISISMQCPLRYSFAYQAVGKTRGHPYRQVAACSGKNRLRGGKVQRFVLRGAAYDLSARPVVTFNHYFKNFSYVSAVVLSLDLPLAFEQDLQALGFHLVRDRIRHVYGRRIRARRILEGKNAIVLDFMQKRDGLLKVCRSFAGESHNDVGRHADRAFCRLDP